MSRVVLAAESGCKEKAPPSLTGLFRDFLNVVVELELCWMWT